MKKRIISSVIALIIGSFLGYTVGTQKTNAYLDTISDTQSTVGVAERSPEYRLQGKTGDILNQAFIKEMITQNQKQIDTAAFVKDSSRPEIKKYAQLVIDQKMKENIELKNLLTLSKAIKK